MLLLIHNIHSGLNLNNLNTLEQYYSLNTNNTKDLNNILLNIDNNNVDINSIKNINPLYLNNNVLFSF